MLVTFETCAAKIADLDNSNDSFTDCWMDLRGQSYARIYFQTFNNVIIPKQTDWLHI